MPVIVRDIDRDAATIIMVDSNLQPENILPSERPKAYKMKLEAIKRQGARTDLTSPKISAKFRSDDEVGQDAGVSGDTMLSIMMEQKKPEKNDITLSGEKLRKYFPRSYTPFQIENTIFKLLDAWQKKRQRDQSH